MPRPTRPYVRVLGGGEQPGEPSLLEPQPVHDQQLGTSERRHEARLHRHEVRIVTARRERREHDVPSADRTNERPEIGGRGTDGEGLRPCGTGHGEHQPHRSRESPHDACAR